jgi:hypothetical protein
MRSWISKFLARSSAALVPSVRSPVTKALLQNLVHQVRVTSRDEVIPTFRLTIENHDGEPKGRTLGRLVHPALHNTKISVLIPWERALVKLIVSKCVVARDLSGQS